MSPREIARKLNAGGSHNINRNAIVAKGVPTIAEQLKAVEWEAVPKGKELAAANGNFDASGSSGKLRGMRPNIPYGMIWCGICDKACDFEEFGLHNLFGKLDGEGFHRGYVGIAAGCHGETTVLTVSFQMLRKNHGKRILAWKRPEGVKSVTAGNLARLSARLALPAPPVRMLLRNRAKKIIEDSFDKERAQG